MIVSGSEEREAITMSDTKNGTRVPPPKIGDKVRVKPGVSDPDFPDMPLGGWSGTVTEIFEQDGRIACTLKLDERTLKSIHPSLPAGELGMRALDTRPQDHRLQRFSRGTRQ